MSRELVIISGGQTGVDRGALDAALELGSECGGWCPEGRRAEDGRIPDRYPLKELAGGYAARTRRNAEDSDGTLILHRGPLTGGTALTLNVAQQLRKPVCLVDAATKLVEEGVAPARMFIEAHGIHRLNVAGPPASHWPGAHHYAQHLIRALLQSLQSEVSDAPVTHS